MKHTYIYKYSILLIVMFFTISCDEDNFLKEEPQDFFTSGTAFVTFEQFESSITDLYARLRAATMGNGNADNVMNQWTGTDIFKDGRFDPNNFNRFGSYARSYTPTHPFVRYVWNTYYKIVSNANTIISRVEVSELTDNEKTTIAAEAKFFRAFAYRYLVYHFGDVPLITAEIAEPRTDFTRAPKTDVLNQMAQDFSDAANELKGITEVVDGRVHSLVAQHYLAETYVALEQWNDAIAAASTVINDAATDLMTNRFGSLASDPVGNVYWDLFRVGNQNRSSGNTEAIWVCQMEADVPGGF
ncbi:MAG: RagB/SusD family nutrient uptake outer membrane protein [Bacteroidetes bacterium]|nr:RagB/SusD family nutrient uptake outer membrane protein [Bacteroidota bacterium]